MHPVKNSYMYVFCCCSFISVTIQKRSYEEIRKIKLSELKFVPDFPKKPFLTTESAENYKGEFQGFPVVIKKFLNTAQVSRFVFNYGVNTVRSYRALLGHKVLYSHKSNSHTHTSTQWFYCHARRQAITRGNEGFSVCPRTF